MRHRRIFTVAFAALMAAPSLAVSQTRVIGGDVVAGAPSIPDAFQELIRLPFTQAEIDLFTATIGPIEVWTRANMEAWNAVVDEEKPIEALAALDLWRTTQVSGPDFLALGLKLSFVRDVATGLVDLDELRNQIQSLEELAAGAVSEAQANTIRGMASEQRGLVAAVESYPEDMLALYRANQAAIDDALDRWAAIGAEEDGAAAGGAAAQ